ncbi:resolvase [Anaerovorax sp. IOR16]|uniref:resolvase n=1 Tax=Anaerovorax sp. IOR16 TaxID=2773458 RepID=UPI0019D25524|nr:resolvase [Anaerovorax sp. IOR16]
MRIYSLKSGSLNEADRLEIARLLIKAGYTVRIGREKPSGRKSSAYVHFVEFEEGDLNATGQP